MDSVLVLTSEAYYVTDYDETSDRLLSVQRVPLSDVTSVELGTFDSSATVIRLTFCYILLSYFINLNSRNFNYLKMLFFV